jgi:CheY-like chemotaxis protein
VLEKEVATSHIDPSQLANSVLNMAINARDAMPLGGKLLLETRNTVLDEAYAEANAEVRPGPYVMLAVSDTGSGMPAAVRDKAFEPFFTTKGVGHGSGLGLSMVYGFVKQSGGHIKIYSEEGHGTTIRLYLPPARGSVETAVSVAAPISGGTETILVVEDDALVRTFVIALLHSLGYQTVAATDSRTALTLVRGGQTFDLLFTDVVLPGGISGRQLADEVAKLRPGTKVLYTSGYTDNAIVHHGRLDEGVLLLSKPYRKPQLAQMVRRAISGTDALSA